jgi:putative membrane protein
MVDYNPKDWFKALFTIHKADTVRALFPLLIFFMFFSGGIVYFENEYLKLSQTSVAKNINVMHTILGFAISMLLVFRTNTAYDRWWEGRRLWGSLVNNSRNLSIKLNILLSKSDPNEKLFFKELIPLYSSALINHLQESSQKLVHTDSSLNQRIESTTHKPNFIANLIIERIYYLRKTNIITAEELLTLDEEMKSFTDICGACERIKNTPIPYSYSVFIKKFVFIYVGTLPISFALTLGYYTIPVTTFIFYVMASLEIIAEEIEGPFGKDNNDLPMEKISKNIKNSVTEIFEKF